MIYELSQLPSVIQNQITHAKAPVEIVNNGQVVATLNPTISGINKKQSLYDIFANADPAVADIEFELPPRTMSNRPIPFEDE